MTISRIASATALLLVVLMASPPVCTATSARDFQHNVSIGGRISATVLVVGLPHDQADIKKLVDIVIGHAEDALRTIDADITRINEAAPRTPVAVGWQTAEILEKALHVARWTGVDIAAAPPSKNASKGISIDVEARTATRTAADALVTATALIHGYLADLIIRYINAGGMHNALVRVGNVFCGLGHSLHGPWKIQVQEDSTTYAKHALNLTVSDLGIATISATELPGKKIYDPHSGSMIPVAGKGATIAMREAAHAQGIAHAVMIAGPEKGMKILHSVPGASGLLVDQKGTFLRKGF